MVLMCVAYAERRSTSTNCLSACFAGSTLLSKEALAGITMTAAGILSLVATVLLFLAFLKCLKRRASMVNVVC